MAGTVFQENTLDRQSLLDRPALVLQFVILGKVCGEQLRHFLEATINPAPERDGIIDDLRVGIFRDGQDDGVDTLHDDRVAMVSAMIRLLPDNTWTIGAFVLSCQRGIGCPPISVTVRFFQSFRGWRLEFSSMVLRQWMVLAGLVPVLLFSGCEKESEPPVGGAAKLPPGLADNPKALIARASEAAQAGRVDEAIVLLERVAELDPSGSNVLWVLATVSQERAEELKRPQSSALYLKSADAVRKFQAASKNLDSSQTDFYQQAIYKEACTLAVAGETEKAMKSLTEAFDAGYARRPAG